MDKLSQFDSAAASYDSVSSVDDAVSSAAVEPHEELRSVLSEVKTELDRHVPELAEKPADNTETSVQDIHQGTADISALKTEHDSERQEHIKHQVTSAVHSQWPNISQFVLFVVGNSKVSKVNNV